MFFDFFSGRFSVFAVTQAWLQKENLPHTAFASVTSTNDHAKSEALKLDADLKVYLADEQTQGRGRGANQWVNPAPGDSLMCTWSYRLPESPKAVTAPIIGLAIYEALSQAFPQAPFSIKPPNDIYLGDKKLLGILVESVTAGTTNRLLVGFGLNVFSHPASLSIATHLRATTGVRRGRWRKFLHRLSHELHEAARACLGSHLTESQRARLLAALNRHSRRDKPFVSVSPFGDLATDTETHSWRDL